MKHSMQLKPFVVPNFAIAETPPRKRQDGMQEAPSFPLSELTEQALSDLCDDFRKRVFDKAGKKDPKGKK